MEKGWLIERGQGQHQDPPLWWAGSRVVGQWTSDANVAIRFSRRDDAVVVGLMMPQLGIQMKMWTVIEHAWG
jgi:hypothetical protein